MDIKILKLFIIIQQLDRNTYGHELYLTEVIIRLLNSSFFSQLFYKHAILFREIRSKLRFYCEYLKRKFKYQVQKLYKDINAVGNEF